MNLKGVEAGSSAKVIRVGGEGAYQKERRASGARRGRKVSSEGKQGTSS